MKRTGRLKQSVCRWCYPGLPLEALCREAAALGLSSVELLGPEEWPTVQQFGLTCAVAQGPGSIGEGWNQPEHHDRLVREAECLLPQIADAGIPNMIVFSGNRAGLSDAAGMENCARGLARLMPLAERRGVTLLMELLSSKADHRDYQCDHTAWGVALAQQIGSERFKLLYDIYHMQIMEGDIIATIRQHSASLGHYHTGGVPGRGEIDETQELNYAVIAQAIADTGYEGYLGHEFIPKSDPMAALKRAVEICTVL